MGGEVFIHSQHGVKDVAIHDSRTRTRGEESANRPPECAQSVKTEAEAVTVTIGAIDVDLRSETAWVIESSRKVPSTHGKF